MVFKRLSRKTIYSSEWINLYSDRVETENGIIIEKYHQLDYPKESVVVIVVKDQQICFINCFRYTLKTMSLELPAGYVDPGEDIHSAAIREVFEETGLVIKQPEFMYSYFPSNGMSNQKIHVFNAISENEIDVPKNHEGIREVKWLPINEIERLIDENLLNDGISLLAVCKYFRLKTR